MSGDVFGQRPAGNEQPTAFPGEDDEAPVDLRALVAVREPARWEALAARIEAAAAPELARRAAGATGRGALVLDLAPVLARALRPALFAAAAALLVAVGLSRGAAADAGSATADEVPAGQLVSDASVAQALLVRAADAPWLAEGRAPSREALAQAIGVEPAVGTSDGMEESP